MDFDCGSIQPVAPRKREREGLHRDRRKFGGVMEVFIVLVLMMDSRQYRYVKNDQITHFKYIVCYVSIIDH